MANYHVTEEGPKPCHAQPGNCPVGGEHFCSLHDAQFRFESNNAAKTVATLSKKDSKLRGFFQSKWGKRFSVGGGIIALSISITACGSAPEPKYGYATPESSQSQSAEPTESPSSQNTEDSSDSSDQDKQTDDSSSKWEKKYEEGKKELEDKSKDLKKKWNDTTENSETDKSDGAVKFQGRSLTPSKKEVQKARQDLKNLKVQPENNNSYDRASEYGQFRSHTVSNLEKRDVNIDPKFDSSTGRAVSGSFIDPYTGAKVTIVKGSRMDADVDHIVPLKEVENSQDKNHPLSSQQKHDIANDPANLQLVASSVNRSKSDKDITNYKPSYKPSQCSYVIQQIEVKASYKLTVDQQEKNSMNKIMSTRCEG